MHTPLPPAVVARSRTGGAAVCGVCGQPMIQAGTRRSHSSSREFHLAQCPVCFFGCVVDPRTDYEAIYDADYYRGRGADPLVNYLAEMDDPLTVRLHEWEGILRTVSDLTPVTSSTTWLDLGCGLGGLVRHLRAAGLTEAVGFDEGYAARYMDDRGIPRIDRAELHHGPRRYDVVTCIEVIEHVIEPIDLLRSAARVLEPGGLLFLTTGNARRFRGRLSRWSYVVPDVHVSFFEPSTLSHAMSRVGLVPTFPNRPRGFDEILRYKILKTLKRSHDGIVERAVPWTIVSRLVDRVYGVSALPVARAPSSHADGQR